MSKAAITNLNIRKGKGKSPSRTRKGTSPRGRFAASSAKPAGPGRNEAMYPVVIHKGEGTDYGVSVPDLPGCFSAGETMQKAIEAAREAIAAHIEGLLIDKEFVPAPKS